MQIYSRTSFWKTILCTPYQVATNIIDMLAHKGVIFSGHQTVEGAMQQVEKRRVSRRLRYVSHIFVHIEITFKRTSA